MKASEMISRVDSQQPNSIAPEHKINWLNDLTNAIYTDLIKEYGHTIINTVANQSEYAMADFIFEDIERLRVGTQEYKKMDIFQHSSGSFYKSNDKLALDPIPSLSNQVIDIIYRKLPTEITQDSIDDYELPLPQRFQKLYEYYLKYNMLLQQREYGEANNYMTLYNSEYDRLAIWYGNAMAKSGAYKTLSRWG